MAFNTKQDKGDNLRYRDSFNKAVGQIRKEESQYRAACREARQNGQDTSAIKDPHPTMPSVQVNVQDPTTGHMVLGNILDPFYGTHVFTKKELYDLKDGKQVVLPDQISRYGEQYATTVECRVEDLKDAKGQPVVDRDGNTIRYPQVVPVKEDGTYTKHLDGCAAKILDSDATHVPFDMAHGTCEIKFDSDGYVMSAAGKPLESVLINEDVLKEHMQEKFTPKQSAAKTPEKAQGVTVDIQETKADDDDDIPFD